MKLDGLTSRVSMTSEVLLYYDKWIIVEEYISRCQCVEEQFPAIETGAEFTRSRTATCLL